MKFGSPYEIHAAACHFCFSSFLAFIVKSVFVAGMGIFLVFCLVLFFVLYKTFINLLFCR